MAAESKEKDPGFQQLRTAVAQWAQLSDDAFERARPAFQTKHFQKNELLVRPGQPARYVYFIRRGLVRLFYEGAGSSGKQTNKSFAREDMFVAGTLTGDGTSDFGIEALEPVETLAVQAAELVRLAAADPGWMQLRSAYVMWLAERKARREKQLLLESAEERFLGFQRDFPDIAERIPQYHVALYLGITDVALSRIKKRLRGE